MTQSREGDRAPDEQSVAMRRQWHAPEFYFMDVGSTGHTGANAADNPGHEDTHS